MVLFRPPWTDEIQPQSNIKQFWSIVYKLFKERFVRFMSGYKNQEDGRIDSTNYTHKRKFHIHLNLFDAYIYACMCDTMVGSDLYH